MAKIRVHELAKQLGISSKETVEHLTRLGVEVRSHASSVEDYLIPAIERSMRGEAPPSRDEIDGRKTISVRGRRQRGRLRAEPVDRPSISRVVATPPPTPVSLRRKRPEEQTIIPLPVAEEKPVEEPAPQTQAVAAVEAESVATAPPVGEEVVKAPARAPAEVAVDAPIPSVAAATPAEMLIEEIGIPEEVAVEEAKAAVEPGAAPRGDTTTTAARWDERSRKRRREERDQREEREKREARGRPGRGAAPRPAQPATAPRAPTVGETVEITDPMPVRDLAKALGLDTSDILRELMMRGAPSTINTSVSGRVASAIASDLGVNVHVTVGELEPVRERDREREEARRRERRRPKTAKVVAPEAVQYVPVPPVVTVMGHVDHGKTTLLDYIRHTRVAARESGGITQHIGASEVLHNGKPIVFIDTPGHEAFTSMRARGAKITDIAVLVVAANDGVMPQTIEAMNHAKVANVPIIVAVNKIDLPSANPERTLQQLSQHDLLPEAWGGSTVTVNVSALTGEGVDALLEYILLVAEVAELKAPIGVPGRAVVIEGQSDSSRGAVATVLVREGHLRVGDPVVCGRSWGRIRAMVRPDGSQVREAGPGTPVEIMGLDVVPEASEELVVADSQKEAKLFAGETADEEARVRAGAAVHGIATLEALFSQVQRGATKDLNLIVKADVQGTLEALTQSIERLYHEEIHVHIIHGSIGSVNESDILLASSTNSIVIAFRVGLESGAYAEAQNESVEIREYDVIYSLIEDIKKAMEGLLEPVYEERALGRAEVRALFKVSRLGVIAGCYVLDGLMRRGERIRVRRGQDIVYQGNLDSLKHVKDDIREIQHGRECGVSLDDFNGFTEGDIIECYTMDRVARTLA